MFGNQSQECNQQDIYRFVTFHVNRAFFQLNSVNPICSTIKKLVSVSTEQSSYTAMWKSERAYKNNKSENARSHITNLQSTIKNN